MSHGDAMLDDKGMVTACPHCGQKNRVPYERLGETGICGNCKAALPFPSAPLEIGQEAQFLRLIGGTVPVLVDFWAPWCGPCRMVAPEMDRVAAGAGGRFLVAKVNTEALPALAQRYQIQGIPTMGVYVSGRELARTSGARPAAAIEAFVRQALAG